MSELVTFDLDAEEWLCEPTSPLTVVLLDLPASLPISPEAREEWDAHNARARTVQDAIANARPVSLRDLRGVYGQFTARNTRTGHRVESRAIKHAEVR